MGLFRGRGQAGSLFLLLLAAAAIVRPWEGWRPPWAPTLPAAAWARVTRAIDGDTIEVELDGEREDVRYIGLDTPETVKPDTPVQCFGPRAHRVNAGLVTGQRVRLVFGVERRDRYGRLLAYVYLQRRLVNAELLRRGLARTLAIPPNTRFAPRFRRLELAAARAGKGLWSAC